VAQRLVDSGVVHNIQEQAQTAGQQIKAAAAEASRAVSGELAKPQKPKHRGFLIFGVIAAAVAAGVAAWKASKPIEDPWKTPAPVTPTTPAPVPATTVTDVKEAVKDTADDAAAATVAAADEAAAASADAADKVAAKPGDSSAKVATDAKTAVKNIASSLNGENKAK